MPHVTRDKSLGGKRKPKIANSQVSAATTGLKRLIGLTNESWLVPFIEDKLVSAREARIDKGWFHPSALHTLCDRKLAFEYLGIKRKEYTIKGQTLRIFHNGSAMHRRWQAYFRAWGILVKHESRFSIESPPIRGAADAIIAHPISKDHSIVELKSINSNGFSNLSGPRDDHAGQLNIYLAGHKINDGMLLYENKNTQEIKIFPVKLDTTRWEQLQFRLLKIVKKILKGQLPDIYNHDGCQSCPFLYFCYSAGSDVESVVKQYGV